MAKFFYTSEEDLFPDQILTDRLLLRRIEYGAFEIKELYDKYSNLTSEETQYVTFEPYDNRKEVKNFIDGAVENFENGDSAGYYMIKLDGYDLIGTASFDPSWEQSIAESGVFIFKQYWGNGYSTERGEAMVEMAFEEYDFEHWISRCHPKNSGSIGAIENYVVDNGGERVGELPNWHKGVSEEGYDNILYFKLSKEDYNGIN